MRANDYQKSAARFIPENLSTKEIEIHALHGISSEVGELHSLYQKVYQGHEFDPYHAFREAGDIVWFLSEYCTACGFTLEDVMAENIKKLEARYSQGHHTVEESLHRKEGDI